MMFVNLFCSYRHLKQQAFHPKDVRVVFKSTGTVVSTGVEEDSVGGPKSTAISSVPDVAVSASRLSGYQNHSFLVRELKQQAVLEELPNLKLVSFKFKVEFSKALWTQPPVSQMDQADEELDEWEDPKIEIVVHEEGSPAPFIILSDSVMHRRQLFSRLNRVWFKNLVGKHRIFELVLNQTETTCRTEDGVSQVQYSPMMVELLKRTITSWVIPNPQGAAAEGPNLLPCPDDLEDFLKTYHSKELKELEESQKVIKEQISILSGKDQSSENAVSWQTLQEVFHSNIALIDLVIDQFKGFKFLLKAGVESGKAACLSIKNLRDSIAKCLQDPWVTKSSSTHPDKGQNMAGCIHYAEQLPWDMVQNFRAVLELVGPEYPNFELVSLREYSLFTTLKSILLAATSYAQLNQRLAAKVICGSVAPGTELSSNKSQTYEGLRLARDFGFMINQGDLLTVWPRKRSHPRLLDVAQARDVTFQAPLAAGLAYWDHSDTHILMTTGMGNLKYLLIDVKVLLTPESTQAEYIKQIEASQVFGFLANTIFSLSPQFILQVKGKGVGEGHGYEATITPLDSEYKRTGGTVVSRLDMGRFSISVVKTCWARPNSKEFFVSVEVHDEPTQTILSCWKFDDSDKSVNRMALYEIPIPNCTPPHVKPTARVAVSQKIDRLLQPTFIQTKGKVFYLSSPKAGFLLVHIFSKDSFFPVSSRKGGLHRAPEGFYFIPDTSSKGTISLYAAKQVDFDPKTFALKKALLRF